MCCVPFAASTGDAPGSLPVSETSSVRFSGLACDQASPSQMLASSPKYSWSSAKPPSPLPIDRTSSTNSIAWIHLTILKPS